MDDFLSGEHGHVAGGVRRPLRLAADRALDAWLAVSRPLRGLDSPSRDVIVAAAGASDLLEHALAELRRSRHSVRVVTGPVAHGGKFQNLNGLLAGVEPADWLLVVDDDVVLPRDFLDRFIAISEKLGFDLAQPAQTLASHAAWRFARRHAFSVARETNFVEIGPVTAFSRAAAAELLPFPDLRYGWGLDAHWAALAAERRWKLGVIDALPVRHEERPVAMSYSTDAAVTEARDFLSERAYVPASQAGRTLHRYRRVPA